MKREAKECTATCGLEIVQSVYAVWYKEMENSERMTLLYVLTLLLLALSFERAYIKVSLLSSSSFS